jgi:hypothetical protein
MDTPKHRASAGPFQLDGLAALAPVLDVISL